MKGAVLAILVFFGGLQSISMTECPCAALCGHKNACEDGSPADDCCKQREREAPGPCFHLEPQTDIDGPVAEVPSAPVTHAIAIPEAAAGPTGSSLVLHAAREVSPPSRGRPLFLQHSALLI